MAKPNRNHPPTAQLTEQGYQFLQYLATVSPCIELRWTVQKGAHSCYLPSANHERFPTPTQLQQILRETDGKNLFVTVNQLHPGCIARAPLLWNGKATSQNDITRITHLVLDFDPNRPSGVPANTQERQTAHNAAQWLADKLHNTYHWEPRAILDTGNGVQILYPIDLPNHPQTTQLLKQIIRTLNHYLQKRFPTVTLDEATTNPAQLTRVPDTTNAKGHEWEDRQHRTVKVTLLQPNTPTLNLDPIREKITTHTTNPYTNNTHTPTTTIQQHTHTHEYEHLAQTQTQLNTLNQILQLLQNTPCQPISITPYNNTIRIKLNQCPFNPNHTHGTAALFISTKGTTHFKCLHQSCQQYTTKDALTTIAQLTEPEH